VLPLRGQPPGFVDAVDDRALRLETGPARLSQFAPVHARAVASRKPYDVRGELDMSQFHILLPAMKFNVCPGPPNLSIGPVWPVAPDRCKGWLDYFFAPGLSEEWLAEFTAWDFQVGAEDVALVEGVQAGASSGALADGQLLEVTEGLIAAFQAYVRARVEAQLDAAAWRGSPPAHAPITPAQRAPARGRRSCEACSPCSD
jgi:ring hydroxylating enzyme alpha subunit